jgi:uncharacterized protein with von Willebrand factor type A (vWA) domain
MLGASGLILASSGVGAVANHQARKRKGHQDKRKQDPIVAIIVDVATGELAKVTQKQLDKYKTEEKAYEACVNHEWDVFKESVEKVKKAAEDRSNWIKVLTALGDIGSPRGTGPDAVRPVIGVGPEAVRAIQEQTEIKRGTERAAAARDQAIGSNCKEPALP